MTRIQEAAAAARGHIDLPKCGVCHGAVGYDWLGGEPSLIPGPVSVCPACGGCGVDTSNSYAIIGRVMVWSMSNGMIDITKTAVTTTGMGYLAHDGTPKGLATALLEVVARVNP